VDHHQPDEGEGSRWAPDPTHPYPRQGPGVQGAGSPRTWSPGLSTFLSMPDNGGTARGPGSGMSIRPGSRVLPGVTPGYHRVHINRWFPTANIHIVWCPCTQGRRGDQWFGNVSSGSPPRLPTSPHGWIVGILSPWGPFYAPTVHVLMVGDARGWPMVVGPWVVDLQRTGDSGGRGPLSLFDTMSSRGTHSFYRNNHMKRPL
jgi:hypothetical protein